MVFVSEHESRLSRKDRKRWGVYYTPPLVVDYILENTLLPLLERCRSIEDILSIRVCDPSCGIGNFLIRAHEFFLRHLSQWARIDSRLERRIQERCLYGFDIDDRAIESLRARLPFSNLKSCDALLEPCLKEKEQFDLVIGNPPYGANLGAANRETLRAFYGIRSDDSACFFMALAARLTKSNGMHALIVPKPFLYSSGWFDVRELLKDGLVEVVDCGALWPDVLLEQVVYFHRGQGSSEVYRSGRVVEDKIIHDSEIANKSMDEFGFILNGVSSDELRLGQKMRESGIFLSDVATNRRGAPLQKNSMCQKECDSFEKSGGQPPHKRILGGRHIGRYSLMSGQEFKALPSEFDGGARAAVVSGAILVQNIVAHVRRPVGHLKIRACLAAEEMSKCYVIVDTVNQLTVSESYSSLAMLGILNSRILGWYVYRFIVGRAERTIHFDAPLTAKIPLPPASAGRILEPLVARMLVEPSEELDWKIEELVCGLYLGSGERGWRELLGGIGV